MLLGSVNFGFDDALVTHCIIGGNVSDCGIVDVRPLRAVAGKMPGIIVEPFSKIDVIVCSMSQWTSKALKPDQTLAGLFCHFLTTLSPVHNKPTEFDSHRELPMDHSKAQDTGQIKGFCRLADNYSGLDLIQNAWFAQVLLPKVDPTTASQPNLTSHHPL